MSANYPVVPSFRLITPIVIDGTAQQVVYTGTPQKGIMLQAPAANIGKVYVGPDNTVAATKGLELAPGQSLLLPLGTNAIIYVKGASAGDRVHGAVI